MSNTAFCSRPLHPSHGLQPAPTSPSMVYGHTEITPHHFIGWRLRKATGYLLVHSRQRTSSPPYRHPVPRRPRRLAQGREGYSDRQSISLVSDILSLCELSGVGNELLILQRCTLGRIADRVDALLRPVGHAHTAVHAGAVSDAGKSVIYGDRRKLA
jgi:hypothetical protein